MCPSFLRHIPRTGQKCQNSAEIFVIPIATEETHASLMRLAPLQFFFLMPADQLSYRRPSTPFAQLTLGQRVKWLLIRRKLTQTAAAQQVGVTQATIANIVNGARKPSAETLMKLARGLNSSPSFIMYGTGFQLSYAEPESDVQAELLEIHKVLSETEQEMLLIFARTLARKPVIAKPTKRKTQPNLTPLQDT